MGCRPSSINDPVKYDYYGVEQKEGGPAVINYYKWLPKGWLPTKKKMDGEKIITIWSISYDLERLSDRQVKQNELTNQRHSLNRAARFFHFLAKLALIGSVMK